MQDVDEVRDFLGSLPVPPRLSAAALLLSMHSRGDLRRAVQSLAKRGYIGCLPFAHQEKDQFVVRLVPEQPPSECRIGVVYAYSADGITIAPRLQHFVAGRLAHIDATNLGLDKQIRKAILDYAALLGSAASTRAVLAAFERATREPLSPIRRGILWAAAGKFDPLFKTLGGAWMYKEKELARWLRTDYGKTSSDPIADRLAVGYHTKFATGEDVSEAAWRVVTGDHALDLGYTGLSWGPITGSREVNALIYAVQFLSEKRPRHKQMDSPLWRAAQAVVKSPRYGGAAHFDAARAIASRDPANAFTLLSNAALYAARSNKSLMPRILGFALELATAGKWHALAGTLRLAQATSRQAKKT